MLVSSNTFRHPALLAKQAVTLDHISNGRLELGLGAGWYEPEHQMFGLDFQPAGERVERLRQAVEVVDLLLRNEVSSYEGRHYQLRDARFLPRPVQRPRPPLTLGAHGPRMLGIAARYADAWNSHGTVDQIRVRNGVLDEHCRRIGRDPASIVRSLYYWVPRSADDLWDSVDAFVDVIERYKAVGIGEFIVDQPRQDQADVLERVAVDVLPKLRGAAAS